MVLFDSKAINMSLPQIHDGVPQSAGVQQCRVAATFFHAKEPHGCVDSPKAFKCAEDVNLLLT